jgi:hypothetical protein
MPPTSEFVVVKISLHEKAFRCAPHAFLEEIVLCLRKHVPRMAVELVPSLTEVPITS